VVIRTDITEIKRREVALAQKTELVDATLEITGERIVVYDPDGNLLACNDHTAQRLEAPVALFEPGATFGDLVRFLATRGDYGDVEVDQAVEERMAEFRRRRPWRGLRRQPDGRVIESRISHFADGRGLLVLREVTDRIVRDEQLVEKSAVLQATLDNIGEGVVVIGANREVLAGNGLAAKLLDAPAALFEPGAKLDDIIRFRIERGDLGAVVDVEACLGERLALLSKRSPWSLDLRLRDGRMIESRYNPMPDGGGVFIYRDITERADHEARLADALRKAERASQAKSEFLAMVSHELRTPMNAIIGLSGLLREGNLPPTERRHATAVETAGESLLVIIKDLLEFAGLDAGKTVLDTAPFDVRALVAATTDVMRHLPQAARLSFHTDVDPAVPATLEGDAGRIRRILVNLLDNAVKHAPSGTVTVKARAKTADAAGKVMLHIEVVDTGTGFPQTDARRLFQPFERRSSADRTSVPGLGLGLATSKRFVDLMGGTIGAESEPGSGSRFWFEIPVRTATSIQPGETASKRDAAENRPLKILVAEDIEANRAVMGAMLERLGHEAQFAEDGAKAIEAAAKHDFDVILMDIQMPHVNGIEATRAIRGLGGRLAAVPIIAVSAHSLPFDRDSAQSAGMNGFLSKPVRRSGLNDALKSLFGMTTPVG